jgi:hypothetical protein
MLALMGHLSGAMLKRYSHIRMAAERQAVESLMAAECCAPTDPVVRAHRRKFVGTPRRPSARPVHRRSLVAGREVDIFRGQHRKRVTHLAPAVPGRHAGAGDFRRNGRTGDRAGPRWKIATWVGSDVKAYPSTGGSPIPICAACAGAGAEDRGITPPLVSWSRDGKLCYLYSEETRQTYVVPLRPGHVLPLLPPSGFSFGAAGPGIPRGASHPAGAGVEPGSVDLCISARRDAPKHLPHPCSVRNKEDLADSSKAVSLSRARRPRAGIQETGTGAAAR